MATPKYKSLKLGPGNLVNKDYESQIYVEAAVPRNGASASVSWDNSTTYALNAAVVYEGLSYNSLIGSNQGNQPDISPAEWAPVDGKDGDVWIQVPAAGFPSGGKDSEIWIKVNNVWRPATGANPITVTLTDGQLASESAIEYPAVLFPFATIEYTVKRGGGHNRKRAGKLTILNDNGAITNYTHEFTEIGSDVNCPFDVSISAGVVSVKYTSDLEFINIELRYILRGWA